MVPTLQLPQQAARLWADPAVRAKIVAMHRDETPLLEMIDELGLTRYLDADGLRDVIVGLDAVRGGHHPRRLRGRGGRGGRRRAVPRRLPRRQRGRRGHDRRGGGRRATPPDPSRASSPPDRPRSRASGAEPTERLTTGQRAARPSAIHEARVVQRRGRGVVRPPADPSARSTPPPDPGRTGAPRWLRRSSTSGRP